MVLLATVVLGLGYNLLMTGIAELAFPHQANGSLVKYNGRVVGSSLIGQQFTAAKFFHGRPSATTPPYNASASSSSNLGPTNPILVKQVEHSLSKILESNPGVTRNQVPNSLIESSASGLDPDITPTGALLQVQRVAKANHLSVNLVRQLVLSHVQARFLWVYGHSYVNVLRLNLALEKLVGRKGIGG